MNTFLSTHQLFQTMHPEPHVEPPVELPSDLKTLLRTVGSNSYAGGFFRFSTPPALGEYLGLWQLNPSECHVFLKCAFGQLVFFHHGEYKLLNPVFNVIDTLADSQSLNFVMDIALCDRPSLESSFFLDIYEQAFARIGAPNHDEIYAFIPAINLGGSRSKANVQKVKMEAEMKLLAQM